MTRTERFTQIVALLVAMGYSALTSWEWAADHLHATTLERAVIFGVFELTMLAFAVASRANQLRGGGRGWQHAAAYLFTAAMSVMAVQESTSLLAGALRFLGGPVASLALWHSLLGLELKASGLRRDGLLAAVLREARERLTASLGIGRRGADSAAIARHRAADRAVNLSVRLAAAREGTRRHARLVRRLSQAVDRAREGLSAAEAEAAEGEIVTRVVRRKGVMGLASIGARYDWEQHLDTGGQAGEEDDVTAYAALLLTHEPPPWTDLTLKQAVAKADAILPDTSAVLLARILAEVGVQTTDASIRGTRSAMRRNQTANQP